MYNLNDNMFTTKTGMWIKNTQEIQKTNKTHQNIKDEEKMGEKKWQAEIPGEVLRHSYKVEYDRNSHVLR